MRLVIVGGSNLWKPATQAVWGEVESDKNNRWTTDRRNHTHFTLLQYKCNAIQIQIVYKCIYKCKEENDKYNRRRINGTITHRSYEIQIQYQIQKEIQKKRKNTMWRLTRITDIRRVQKYKYKCSTSTTPYCIFWHWDGWSGIRRA